MERKKKQTYKKCVSKVAKMTKFKELDLKISEKLPIILQQFPFL